MRTTEAVITEIFEAYSCRFGKWVGLAEIAQPAGLTRDELREALVVLMDEDEDFRAEPEPFGHRITPEVKAVAPVIGGEARHLIRWQA